jgi:hypothetical protein
MEKNVRIEMTVRSVETDAHDTAGHIWREGGGCFPLPPLGAGFKIPIVVVRPRLPTPLPAAELPTDRPDVQGFQLEVTPAAEQEGGDTAGYLWHIYALTAIGCGAVGFFGGVGVKTVYDDVFGEETTYTKYD